MLIWIDIAGWIGAVFLLGAYTLVSIRKAAGDSWRYQLLNIVGGGLIVINSYHYHAYPSVGVNVIWVGIAVYTLWRKKTPSGMP